MTPSDVSALPLPGGSRGTKDNRSVVAAKLAARRQRVRAIRRWVITGAVVLFIALAVVVSTQTKFTSSSVASTSSSGTSGSGTSGSGASSTTPGTSSGQTSSLTTSQS